MSWRVGEGPPPPVRLGPLSDGLADVSVPTLRVVTALTAALDTHRMLDMLRSGGYGVKDEAAWVAAKAWVEELERAVLRR